MKLKYFATVAFLLFTTACAEQEHTALACPNIGIVQTLNMANTPAYKAEFGHFSGKCSFKDSTVSVKGHIDIAMKQSRLSETTHDLPIFFALVDPEQNIIEKVIKNLSFEFDGTSFYAILEETFDFTFESKDHFNAQNYEILIGFQK